MLKTTVAEQQNSQPRVKVDPTLRRLRIIRILLYIGLALWAIGIVLSLIGWLLDRNAFFLSPLSITNYIFIVVYAVVILIFHLTLKRFWNRLEQRRQMAAADDKRLIADQQPAPDPHALTLPLTIGQRPKKSTFLIFFSSMFVGAIIAAIVVVALIPHFMPSTPHARPLPPAFIWIFIGCLAFLLLLYMGIFFAVFYAKVRQQVTITQDGLIKMGMFHKVHSVPWRDARLFAINGVYGSLGYKQPVVYELASENDIIRWGWMRRNNARVMFLAQPTASPEEYERQMQGLLSMIAANTHLPLYDLRKKEVPSN